MNKMKLNLDKKAIFLILVLVGFMAFELFNFDSSRQGLESLIGTLTVFGIQGLSLASVLAIAACAIDLGGLASIFTEEDIRSEPIWIYGLGIAWLLAATINAWLTWWVLMRGMSINNLDNPFITSATMLKYVPVALAAFVFLIRVSLIGSLVSVYAKGQKPQRRKQPQKVQPHRPPQQMTIDQVLKTIEK